MKASTSCFRHMCYTALALSLSSFSLCAVAGEGHADTENPSVSTAGDSTPVSPQMRAEERDDAYYSRIACQDLQQVPAESDAEVKAKQRRSKQCLDQYRAFLPR